MNDAFQDGYTYGQNMSPSMQPMSAGADPINATTWVFAYPQNYQNALMLIRNATGGETADRIFYSWMIERAPSSEDKQIIAGIRQDEIGHYGYFRQLYKELTGSPVPPVPEETFTPPASYCEGLARALKGEQAAVQKYRQILYAMQTRDHFNILTEIITDEIRHGILYSYLYTRNGCRG